MKIIITGAKGMLGHALMEVFSHENPLGWDLAELDITNQGDTMEKLTAQKPDVIINAAAYTNVDKAEEEKELAFKVNAQGVKNLALAASAAGATLVHYSTDYVFDGTNQKGYKEEDVPSNPVNAYGASKLAGENEMLSLIKEGKLKGYILRSSWLFGPDGKNFVQTIISLYENNSQIKVVNDQWGKPTYTKDLAKTTRQIIENDSQSGVYHIVNEPPTNWYEFTKEIIQIKFPGEPAKEIIPVDSSQFPRPAKRPNFSVLLNTKIPPLRSWKDALAEYIPLI